MLGTSLSPSSPRMTSGFVRFIHATRLFVVPRSMPTTLSWLSNSIWNMRSFIDQIRDVLAAVQQSADLNQVFAVMSFVPCGEVPLKVGIEPVAHGLELQFRGSDLRFRLLFEGH